MWLIYNLLGILSLPRMWIVFIAVCVFAFVAAGSNRAWVQCLIAVLFFILSTVASIWVLQLGWALASLGVLLALSGAVWKLIARSPSTSSEAQPVPSHEGRGLIWSGLGLVAAPFANAFLLMPILENFIH